MTSLAAKPAISLSRIAIYAVLIIAGRFDPATLLPTIKAKFGGLKKPARPKMEASPKAGADATAMPAFGPHPVTSPSVTGIGLALQQILLAQVIGHADRADQYGHTVVLGRRYGAAAIELVKRNRLLLQQTATTQYEQRGQK